MKILERKDNLQMFWLKHTLDRNDSKGPKEKNQTFLLFFKEQDLNH